MTASRIQSFQCHNVISIDSADIQGYERSISHASYSGSQSIKVDMG